MKIKHYSIFLHLCVGMISFLASFESLVRNKHCSTLSNVADNRYKKCNKAHHFIRPLIGINVFRTKWICGLKSVMGTSYSSWTLCYKLFYNNYSSIGLQIQFLFELNKNFLLNASRGLKSDPKMQRHSRT